MISRIVPIGRTWLTGLLAGFLFLNLAGCSGSDSNAIQTLYGQTMGTSYNIKYVGSKSSTRAMQLGIDSLLAELNETMSTYLDDSELSQLNENFSTDWIPVSDSLFKVVSRAIEISQLSHGAFDITVGPLVDLWGFGPEARPDQIPDVDVMQATQKVIGYQAVELRSAPAAIRKTEPRRLDLSAIAKGYGVDLVADYLVQQGVENYLIEIGGEMRLSGLKPDGETWRVAIETPEQAQRQIFKILALTDVAIATSGDYRNYFEVDGQRYSHTIDPATGYPITHSLASVSVLADNCMDADGFATAMMVLGVEQSLALAEQQNLAVLLIEKSADGFIEHTSSQMNTYLEN